MCKAGVLCVWCWCFFMCYTPLPLTLYNLSAVNEQKSFTGSLIQLNVQHLERFFVVYLFKGQVWAVNHLDKRSGFSLVSRVEGLSQRHDLGPSSCIRGFCFFFCHLEGLPEGGRKHSGRVGMHGSGRGAIFLTPTSDSLLSEPRGHYIVRWAPLPLLPGAIGHPFHCRPYIRSHRPRGLEHSAWHPPTCVCLWNLYLVYQWCCLNFRMPTLTEHLTCAGRVWGVKKWGTIRWLV